MEYMHFFLAPQNTWISPGDVVEFAREDSVLWVAQETSAIGFRRIKNIHGSCLGC